MIKSLLIVAGGVLLAAALFYVVWVYWVIGGCGGRRLRLHRYEWGLGPSGGTWWMYCQRCGEKP